MGKDDEIVPTLNRFIQSISSKGETTTSYTECIQCLANISSVNDKSAGKEGFDRLLTRLLQHGHIKVSSVEALLSALRTSATKETIPLFTRVLFYLTQLAMGPGAAGTPMPMPANRGSLTLAKAVDTLPPEILSGAWADLSDEKSPFMRKQGSMRALAALAHAALVSKPDDPMYPAGLLITLERLLDTIDNLRVGKNSLASLLAATVAAEAGAAAKRKNMVQEHKQQMEMQALLRLAFSTARACLTKSGLMQIAQRSFPGINSPDAVCARHSLALAAMVAKDISGVTYAQHVGPYLQNNIDMAKRTGVLFAMGPAGKGRAGGAAPAVFREDMSNYLNLRDASARVYLARGCAAAIQGGMGDIHGSGAIYWEALALLACGDPSDMVGLEAIRAMFGASFPHSEPLRKKYAPTEAEVQDVGVQGRMLAASWQMVVSMADNPAPAPDEVLPPVAGGIANELTLTSIPSGEQPSPTTTGVSFFGRIMTRVLALLQSRSCSLVAAGAKTAAVILEARAWSVGYSGHLLETESVKKFMRTLQSVLMGVFASDLLGAVERCAVGEALVWLQLSVPDDPRQTTLPPHLLVRAASQGGLAVQPVVKALFADPWPEGLAYSFLFTLLRRLRCSTPLAGWCCQLAGALAAGTPSHIPRDMLVALWDAAPGKDAIRGALELLGSPMPPIAQPLAGTQVEVKALAAVEEQAYENLRATAAWWIGEHVNAIAGVVAWKPPSKASVALEFLGQGGSAAAHLEVGERLALAAQVHAPLIVMAMAHLQRHMLTASYEVKVACAQALSKIAARSPEPFRIQAYATLRAMAGSCASAPTSDPMGLAPTILPVLEVLDAMYAGEQVVAVHVNMHGAEAKAWPAPALASLRRRHEWLLGAIAQRVGGVPKDAFFPLGRKSKALLNPDEPVEPELLEADEDEKALDAAAVAAAANEEPDPGYDDEYTDDQYYADDQYYDDGGGGGSRFAYKDSDPLAKWKEGQNGDYSAVAAVSWKGLGESSSAYAPTTNDEEDARFGKVLFSFNGVNDDEMSVAQGDRVRVLYNMGDWMQVMANSGQQGIVPSSYVQMEEQDAGSTMSRQSSAAQPSFNTGTGSAFYGQQDQYDQYGDGGYNGYVYDGAGQPEYAMYDGDGEAAYKEDGGGFDDFGATLLAAAEARAQAQARATERNSQRKEQQLNRNASIASSASTVLQPQSSTMSVLQGQSSVLQQSYSMQSSIASTPRGGPIQPVSGGWAGYQEEVPTQQPAYVPQPEPVSEYAPQPQLDSEQSRFTVNSSDGGEAQRASSMYAPVEDSEAPAPGFAVGGRARVMYEFNAESAEELSIGPGDELEVLAVLEDWLQVTRLSDGQSGLVPAAYVQ